MNPTHIEAEIASHLQAMPDVAPEILEDYRARLIEMNKDVDDPALMRRPGIAWESRVNYQLRTLAARLPRNYAIRQAVQMATGGRVDTYTYGILKAMYNLGNDT